MNKKDLENKSFAYALKNALLYNGKAEQNAVISGLFNEGLKKEEVKKNIKKISEIVRKVNSLSVEEQKKEFKKFENETSKRKIRKGLPELPNARKGKVIMRIAPSPSGALHIGHAMTACISFLLVQKYGGKFYVRIEDTNPDNIYKPAYNLIKKDSDWLFKKKEKVIIQSKRMKTYYRYIEKLIRKKYAYVCTCSSEKFKGFLNFKENCPCRNNDVEENLFRWKKMLDKSSRSYKEGEAVLRFKSSMNHPNPAMRDFPLARINQSSHPLQKKKYKVWPLMNLSVAIDDIELGMTHIIRAKDHRDNSMRQKMIYDALGKKFPWTSFLGRFKFKDMELSATKMRKDIEEKKYSGWNDPRLPTIITLRKKGYKPEAFWKFAERIGFSESDKVMDKKEYFELLDYFNRNI
jgi:glutamyl-tRNA synthetase